MADDSAQVIFGGDATGGVAASQQVAAAVKNSVAQMHASLEGLNSKFDLIGKGFASITAIVAGGIALKSFVSDAINTTNAAVGLGKSLGVSATEASVFAQQLDDVGVSQDSVAAAGKRITMALAGGGDKLRELGVATKDANGNFRNSRDIMLDVNEKLRGFREGTDRNIEAQKIYGRSYQDLMPMVQKFTEVSRDSAAKTAEGLQKWTEAQEEARAKTEALNLVVGQESIDAAKKYAAAKRDMNDVIEGVNRTVGEVLIPKLTQMAEWFNSVGPAAVTVMRGVMDGYMAVQDAVADSARALMDGLSDVMRTIGQVIADCFGQGSEPMTGMQFFANVITVVKVAFMTFSMALQSGINVIVGAFRILIVTASTALRQLNALFTLDFKSFKTAGQQWSQEVQQIITETVEKGAAIANAGGSRIQAALLATPTAAKKVTEAKGTSSAGERSTGAPGAGEKDNRAGIARARAEALLAMRKEMLAEELRLLESQHQRELLDDRAFYAAKLSNTQAAIDSEAEAKRAELAGVDAQMQATANEGQRNALLAKRITLEGELAVLAQKRKDAEVQSSEELRKAEQKRYADQEQQRIAHNRKMADLDADLAEQEIAQQRTLGAITATEELAAQRNLIQQRYTNEKAALDAQLELARENAQERMKIMDQLAQAQARLSLDMQKNSDATAAEAQKAMLANVQELTQGMGGALQGMVNRTTSMHQVLGGLRQNALRMAANAAAKEAQTWIAKELLKTQATLAGNATRTGSDATAATTSGTMSAGSSILQIMNAAYVAAANAFKALAGIPIVGPALAVGAGAMALATVGGFARRIASARGGYDIPAGVNPITQLHEKEMVLPAKQADVVRQMADSGGYGGGSVHIHGAPNDTVRLGDLADILKRMKVKHAFV